MGCRSDDGSAWTSSNMMTLRAIRWSLRQALVRFAKSDSKNRTFVVTMSGASQFSEARRLSSVSFFGSNLEWCSRTISRPSSFESGAKTSRKTSAFWVMMLVKGITRMTRRWPFFKAWCKAKSSEERVLPPPVGTVKEKKPLLLFAAWTLSCLTVSLAC